MRMSTSDVVFAGSIPATYDRYLGPLLFEPYAQDLAERLRDLSQGRVLEIAAGTGIVTRALVKALPPSVQIIATDLNPAMLDIAATRLKAPNVIWQQADAQELPFEEAEFDAVVCQFGVMFFPDRVGSYREALHVLQPGGRLLFNVWGKLEDNEASQVVSDAVAEVFPGDPPRFLARTPFGYANLDLIRDELEVAGFERIEIEAVTKVSRAPSSHDVATGLCQGTPLRSEIEARAPNRLQEVTDQVIQVLEARYGSSGLEAPMRAYVVSARSPQP
jgi:ubiquinone/menaquinone biosynthesis C-methylase UbiE